MSSSAPPPPPPPPPGPPGGPPSGGGYGAPPPSPYGSPHQGPYSATDAFSYGWATFRSRPGEVLVPILVVLVVVVVVQVGLQLVLRTTLLSTTTCQREVLGSVVNTRCGPGLWANLVGASLAGLLGSLIAQALGAGLIKNALNVVDGGTASVAEVFVWATKSQVLVTALLVAVVTAAATLLCYLPGIVAGYLLNFAMFFVVDKGLAPVDAIKASVTFIVNNLSGTLLFYVLGVVAFVVGACLCLVGLLVAAPVVLVGAAYTFRRLHGEQVAPVS